MILILMLAVVAGLNGQNLESEVVYPDTLQSTNDTVYINSPQWSEVKALRFVDNDSINWGTYGYKGVHFKVWTDNDTITIPHVNHPYDQHVKIPLASGNETSSMVLRFQATYSSDFSDEYVKENKQTISIATSEIYELGNIILYLSECSNQTNNRPSTEYAQRVTTYFDKVKNHPLINILSKKCMVNHWSTYYGFRENSISYEFQEDYLEYDTPYKHVYHDDTRIMGGHFRNMLFLVQDFVNVSRYRDFYQQNLSYYRGLEKRQSDLLPIRKMWNWIETQFPQRMDSYKVLFSPLVERSHSTQKFNRGFFKDPEFTECVMFINSSEYLDLETEYHEQLKEGLMSGIVFTEIDHNYVNPTSSIHIEKIKGLMHNKDFWASEEAQQNYRSEYAIFNEYMTHSLFCLYAAENYDAETADTIISKRVQLMERRGYSKFKDFNVRFMTMMKDNEKSVFELYSAIIGEMGKVD